MTFAKRSVFLALCLSLADTKFYRPFQPHQYNTGPGHLHDQGKPTSRHE